MDNDFVKITNAAYKLLDFFPDGDPLKNKAKEKALAILENLTLVSDASGWVSLKKEKAAAELLDDIEVLETYLKLGKYQGWIDNMNFLILTKEYDKIKSQINPPKGFIRQNLEIIPSCPTSDVSDVGQLASKERKEPSLPQNSVRQRKILDILSKREKTQVSDIIKELPNITKRTIRRDLDDLLKKGKIMRFGEWNQVFYQISKDTAKNQENNLNLDRTRTLS